MRGKWRKLFGRRMLKSIRSLYLQVTKQPECLTVGVVIKSLVATISRGKRRAALILLGNWDDQFEEIVLMGICTLFHEPVLSGLWEVVSQLVSKQLARTLASHSETRKH